MLTTVSLALIASAPAQHPFDLSSQGWFTRPLASRSGEWSLEVTPTGGDLTHVESDVTLVSSDGWSRFLGEVDGTGFLISDAGQLVVTYATHCETAPVTLTVMDQFGNREHKRRVVGLVDPTLSCDGDQVVFGTREGTAVLGLERFDLHEHPRLFSPAVSASGTLAGIDPESGQIVLRRAGTELGRFPVPEAARALEFDGERLYVLTSEALYAYDDQLTELYRSGASARLRDLWVDSTGVHVGVRTMQGSVATGRHLWMRPETGTPVLVATSSMPIPAGPNNWVAPNQVGPIPWPLAPNAQHPIGNTYGEYQRYGSTAYMHPGVDVMGQPGQPVYAVAAGEVKAILTTSGQYHWRVATGFPGAGTSTGYLYAHLIQSSIAVDEGDMVEKGEYLGDLVGWPVANFTHCHFARIKDTGNQWSGNWMCTDNPHLDFENIGENSAPVFEDAIPGEQFAFCENETSNYLDPNNLSGQVDIIAHVGDQIDSSWVCSVQGIRYSIFPTDGSPPIVDDKWAVFFDMRLDTYMNGPFDPFLVDLLYKEDGTCDTDGDYGSREFFHIITNSDGDKKCEPGDEDEAWDTTATPNGTYRISVRAWDVAGNQTTAWMTVTVNN